jgi:hypothetical protein
MHVIAGANGNGPMAGMMRILYGSGIVVAAGSLLATLTVTDHDPGPRGRSPVALPSSTAKPEALFLNDSRQPRYMLCVTPSTVCHAASAPEGQPCSCFHPMRGATMGTILSLETIEADPRLLPEPSYDDTLPEDEPAEDEPEDPLGKGGRLYP